MASFREVEIAKWLMATQVDLKKASFITGIDEKRLATLRRTLEGRARYAFLPGPLEVAISGLGAGRKLNFVQIGANDGKSGDPVFRHIMSYGARALLVEPQPWLIDELRANYAGFDGDVKILNQAVGEAEGSLTLYFPRRDVWQSFKDKRGKSATILAGLDAELLARQLMSRLEIDLESAKCAVDSIEVAAAPLSVMLRREGFDDVDVLQVDCEGFDVKVIMSLGDIRPSIINFEHVNLSRADWAEFLRWAEGAGYGFIQDGLDTVALRNSRYRFTK